MLNPVLWPRSNRFSRIIVSFFLFIFFSPNTIATVPELFTKNDDSPIEINSDNANFDEKTGNTRYQGNVHASQGLQHLWSDSLIIHRTREGKIDHIMAQGTPAHFISHPNTNTTDNTEIRGKANFIHYYPETQKIIFLQNAELVQNDRLIRGAHLIYFINHKTLISETAHDSKTVVIIQPKSNKENK